MYHGTSKNRVADNIREKGIKKSKGGTGVSKSDDAARNLGTSNNVSRSKGKVYFTKKKRQARSYTVGGIFGDTSDSRIIKANIPHDHYANKSRRDILTRKLIKNHGLKWSPRRQKAQAAISGKSISPAQIERSSKYKGKRQFATAKNMKKYLGSSSGRKRFALGAAQAIGSSASAAYAAKKLAEKVRNRNK